jgi:integrase
MGSIFLRTRIHKDGKKADYWCIEYRVNGKTRRETVGKKEVVTKTIARELLKKRELQVKLGQWDMIDAIIPTLNEFAEEYLKYVRDVVKKRSWSRDVFSLKYLKAFFGDRKLSEITPKDVDDYKESRLSEVAPATVNRELSVLRHLFNIAKRWKKFFSENPVSESGLISINNQKERILTYEEEEKLLASSNSSLRAILICALNTGMRKSEILTLKWSNVDLENNVITLEHTNTKSKKTRRIPLNSKLRKLLLEQKLKGGGSKYVFLSEDGTPYKREDSLNQAFNGALRRAGIKGFRFHDLRHTAATRMIEYGASIVAVSRILGHADLKTTMRYAHPEDSLKEAVESLTRDFSNLATDQFTDKRKDEN